MKCRTALLVAAFCCVFASLSRTSHATFMAVDFGMEYVKVAAPRGHSVDICLNEQSHRKTEVSIAFRGDERYFGSDATAMAARFPDHVAFALPQLVGRPFCNETLRWLYEDMHFSFPVQAHGGGRQTLQLAVPPSGTGARSEAAAPLESSAVYTAEELLGMVIQYLKQRVEADVGGVVRDAVFAVPASFTPRQRQAVVDAAAIAGVRAVALLHATTAAALQLGMQNHGLGDEPRMVLVYDMGAGSTDAAVYRFDPPTLGMRSATALGTIRLLGRIVSDDSLGGRSIDACLAGVIDEHYRAKFPTEPSVLQRRTSLGTSNASTLQDRKALVSLMRAAKKAKEVLSANKETPVTVEGIAKDRDFSTKLSRAVLEERCQHVWKRAVAVRDRALQSAGVSISALDRFEVIGGGARVPVLLNLLGAGYTGRSGGVDRTLNADEAVAVGAGYYGAALVGHFRLKGFQVVEPYRHSTTLSISSGNTTRAQAPPEQRDSLLSSPNTIPWGPERELFSSRSMLPSRVRIQLNVSRDFFVRTSERIAQGSDDSEPTTFTTITEITGVDDALRHVGYFDKDEAGAEVGSNVSHVIRVDARLTEGAMVSLERADVVVRYTVNVSKRVRVRSNATSTEPDVSTTADADQDDIAATDEDDEPPAATDSKASAKNRSTSGKSTPFRTVVQVSTEQRERVFPLKMRPRFFSAPTPMLKEESQSSRGVLRAWRDRDARRLELSTAKNQLDEYLAWCRADGFLDPTSSSAPTHIPNPSEVQDLQRKISEIQDWFDSLSDDETTVDALRAKLREARVAVRVALRQPPDEDTIVNQEASAKAASSDSQDSTESRTTGDDGRESARAQEAEDERADGDDDDEEATFDEEEETNSDL